MKYFNEVDQDLILKKSVRSFIKALEKKEDTHLMRRTIRAIQSGDPKALSVLDSYIQKIRSEVEIQLQEKTNMDSWFTVEKCQEKFKKIRR